MKDPIQTVLFPKTADEVAVEFWRREAVRANSIGARLQKELEDALEIQKTYADAYNELLEKRK